MATTESGTTSPVSPSAVGRHLRAVRKAKGLSRAEVARSAGLTRRELAAYERGKVPVPDSDLWCLAGSCGVDVSELLPHREPIDVGSDLGALTVGETVNRLRATGGADGILREYLAMIYELRNLPPGTRPPMREEDLATLANVLGGTPDAIEARLHELIGASREEAARLRSMILPPRVLTATPPATPAAQPVTATPPAAASEPAPMPVAVGATAAHAPSAFDYPPPSFDFATAPPTIGDPAAADRFFAAPHAEDPFAPPPPLTPPLTPLAGPAPSRSDAVDPFAPPTTAPVDPFAPPTTAPVDPFAPPTTAPVDPFAAPAEATPGDPVVTGPTNDPFGPTSTPTDPVGPTENPLAAVEPRVERDLFAPVGSEPASPGDPWPHDPTSVPADEAEMVVLTPPDAPDDPFAALRVPIDGAEVIDLDSPSSSSTPPPPDPSDAWLDRAATAAEELVADRLPHPEPPDAAEPVPPVASTPAEPAPIAWSLDALGTAPAPVPAPDPGRDRFPEPDPLEPRAAREHPANQEPEAAAPDPAERTTTPTTDGFVPAGTDWEVGGIFPATAMADDGALALRRADVRWALADVTARDDFTVRVAVNFTSGAGFGILFRVTADTAERITGYSFDVDPIYSGGAFLVRQWTDSRQHWKPLAQTPVADGRRLYGAHVIEVSVRRDALEARIDGEEVMRVDHLSRCSIDAGHEPCRGNRVGIQAWSTTEVTVERLLLASHP